MALRGCPDIKLDIADGMGVTIQSVQRWVRVNDDNLTKATCIEIIKAGFAKEGLELTDAEILEEVSIAA